MISDTHGYLDDAVFKHFENCDEIWHAGDFGGLEIAEKLSAFKPLKGVCGNIDGKDITSVYTEKLQWHCENVSVYMTHIGGSPPRYNTKVKAELTALRPNLFICGHSHILKIMYDESVGVLHINPGAAGKEGWHKVRTIVRLVIEGDNMRDCEVIELGPRTA